MHKVEKIREIISEKIVNIPYNSEPKGLYDPVSYILNIGGKRIRPVFVLLSCDMFGGDIHKAIVPALGMEMFHNFTLVHDDIMDNADFRRGKETVHNLWGANQAILSGDAMLILANKMMTEVEDKHLREVMQLYNDCGLKVCEGQQFDMNFEKINLISVSEYLKMIELKTAVLIAGCLRLGGIIAETTLGNKDIIEEFGINLGLAFQIEDDYLDSFGDFESFGKKIGGDIIVGKKTFLMVKAMELADEVQKKVLVDLMQSESIGDDKKIEGVIDIYEELGVGAIALKQSRLYFDKAMELLDKLDVDPSRKTVFKEFSLSMLNRSN